MMQFFQSHSDGITASATGTVVSAAAVVANPPLDGNLLGLLVPIITGVLSGFAALGVKILLSIWYARRLQKKELLLQEAKSLREDEDVSNDTKAAEKETEAKLIDAELQAITKVIDK